MGEIDANQMLCTIVQYYISFAVQSLLLFPNDLGFVGVIISFVINLGMFGSIELLDANEISSWELIGVGLGPLVQPAR